MKIICIGSTSKDIFFPTKEGVLMETPDDILAQKKVAFELGAKYHIDNRYESLGGCSTNVASGLAQLGEDVGCYTSIGDDSVGKWIQSEFKKNKISHELVTVQDGCQSDLSSILVDQQSADRIIFSNQVANQKLVFDSRKIKNPHWFFIGDLSGNWQQNLDEILSCAKEKKIKIAFNPRQKTIHEDATKIIHVIGSCDILFVNKDEAMEIVSACGEIAVKELLENEEYLLRMLNRLGSKIVALTDGIRGAWIYDGKKMLHGDAVRQKAVDSTGAGDAFTSGFFASYVKNHEMETCLKWGIANSSNSVKEYGGQKGLLDENGIVNMAKDVKINILN